MLHPRLAGKTAPPLRRERQTSFSINAIHRHTISRMHANTNDKATCRLQPLPSMSGRIGSNRGHGNFDETPSATRRPPATPRTSTDHLLPVQTRPSSIWCHRRRRLHSRGVRAEMLVRPSTPLPCSSFPISPGGQYRCFICTVSRGRIHQFADDLTRVI